MIPSNPTLIPRPFADEGVAATIPDNKQNFGEASWREGFPTETGLPLNAGGIPPRKADFNGVLKALSDHIFFVQAGGQYAWSDIIDYRAASFVVGSDGAVYLSLQESGPNVAGVGEKDPTLDDGTYWLNVSAKLIAPSSTQYEICEFYDFRHPTVRPGMVPRYGTLINNAAATYPAAWAYLQTADGQLLCKTEAEWQAMSTADPWNGVGGVPFFVQDLGAGTLRIPDTRGMYAEDAGFDSLGVGGVKGPGLPNITGSMMPQADSGINDNGSANGAFVKGSATLGHYMYIGTGPGSLFSFDASRSNSIYGASTTVRPRSFGVLPCVYLGA